MTTATETQPSTRYYTGTPCKNGHISERNAASRACLECIRERAAAKRAYDIAYRPEYAARKRELRRERWKEREAARRRDAASDRTKWAAGAIRSIRHRAKKKGLEFSITARDIQLPEVCPVFGIPLVVSFGKSLNKADSPSVDRIDNTRGYVPGNVMVISTRANLLKKDATVDEIRKLLKYMEGAPSQL